MTTYIERKKRAAERSKKKSDLDTAQGVLMGVALGTAIWVVIMFAWCAW